MHEKNKGVTLVELLLVMAIIVVLATMMTGAINPIALVGRANDSKRKKDLGRIRVSFEDYYNDKGCYPNQNKIAELSDSDNCSSGMFSPWLNSWPCDPETKQPYYVYTEDSDCPDWFKVITNLGNENDTDIPEGWYDNDEYYRIAQGALTVNDANYGTSSTNVNWYDYDLGECDDECRVHDVINEGSCGAPPYGGCVAGDGRWCYIDSECASGCRVESCP